MVIRLHNGRFVINYGIFIRTLVVEFPCDTPECGVVLLNPGGEDKPVESKVSLVGVPYGAKYGGPPTLRGFELRVPQDSEEEVTYHYLATTISDGYISVPTYTEVILYKRAGGWWVDLGEGTVTALLPDYAPWNEEPLTKIV